MTTQKGEQTRGEIVACAQRLFYERGFDHTSFTDIVTASGLLRGNIYHYFKTKDDILRAVVDNRLDEFRGLLQQWEAAHGAPRQRLLAFVEMVSGRVPELKEYGCPIGSLNAELGKGHPELQETARALFDLFRDWLTVQFKALGHADDAPALALHLLGRAQGIAMIGHVYRDAALIKRETAQLARWIAGITPPAARAPSGIPPRETPVPQGGRRRPAGA